MRIFSSNSGAKKSLRFSFLLIALAVQTAGADLARGQQGGIPGPVPKFPLPPLTPPPAEPEPEPKAVPPKVIPKSIPLPVPAPLPPDPAPRERDPVDPIPAPAPRIPGPAPRDPQPLPLPPPVQPAPQPVTPAPARPATPPAFPPELDPTQGKADPGPAEFTSPDEALETLDRAATQLAKTVRAIDKAYPSAKRPLWTEAFREQEAPYTKILREIILQQIPARKKGEQPTYTIALDQYPVKLVEFVRAIRSVAKERKLSGEEWRLSLLAVHQAYERTLLTVYVDIEMLKRAHLSATGNAILFGKDQDQLLQAMEALFERTQETMGTMARMRTSRCLDGFMPYHAGYGAAIWEETYGKEFFFGGKFKVTAPFLPRAIDSLFLPFYAALDKDARPQDPFKPDPNAPALQKPNGTAAPGEPDYVQNNERLRKLILSLQNKLNDPTIPADVKTKIEAILNELRPGLAPLKPLPPKKQEGDEEPDPNDPFNQKKKKTPRPDLVA